MSCGCNDDIRYTCTASTNARCVWYRGDIPEYSELFNNKGCVTVHNTTEDLYKLLGELKKFIDLDSLKKRCLDLNEGYKLVDVLQPLVDYKCNVSSAGDDTSSSTSGGCYVDINSLNLYCLESPCGNGITSLKLLLQAMINEICTLKNRQ